MYWIKINSKKCQKKEPYSTTKDIKPIAWRVLHIKLFLLHLHVIMYVHVHVFVYRHTWINLKTSISKMSVLFRNRAISLKRDKKNLQWLDICA